MANLRELQHKKKNNTKYKLKLFEVIIGAYAKKNGVSIA